VARATATANGRAVLAGLEPKEVYRLVVAGPRGRGDLRTVEIDYWEPKSSTIRLEGACVLAGRVVDPRGRPVAGAEVSWLREEGPSPKDWDYDSTESGEDGTFRFEDAPEGEVDLHVEGALGREGARARVFGGGEPVTIVVDPGEAIRLRVEDWPADVGQVEARLFREGEKPERIKEWRDKVVLGEIQYDGLPADETFTLWVGPVGGDRCLFLTGIRPGSPERSVRLTKGKTISGRLHIPDGCTSPRVRAVWQDIPVRGEVEPDGSYVIRGLPDVTWSVGFSVRRGDERRYSSETRVPAGSSLDLTLED
jgi:hypothetical protein